MQEITERLRIPQKRIDLVIDSDAFNEIDDQFAISYALRAPETFDVKAIFAAPFFNKRSSSPMDGMEKSFSEIKKLLTLAEEKVPVFKGSSRYLPDENTPVESEAAGMLCRVAMQYSDENPLYVVAIGALTNIASALLIEPEIAKRMVLVSLCGNSIDWPTNYEFNLRQDIAAGRVVFSSGVPLVLLPCHGVVSSFRTTGYELKHFLSGKDALCDYLVQQTIDEAESYARGKVWSRVIWDVTTIGWLRGGTHPFMQDRFIPTPIPENDNHWSFDFRRQLCRYVYNIDRDALLGDLFGCLSGDRDLCIAYRK